MPVEALKTGIDAETTKKQTVPNKAFFITIFYYKIKKIHTLQGGKWGGLYIANCKSAIEWLSASCESWIVAVTKWLSA